MSNLKEYLKTLNTDTSKKEIVELIKAIYQSILEFEEESANGVSPRERIYRKLVENREIKHAPRGSYLLRIQLQNNYYGLQITKTNDRNPSGAVQNKILKRESPIFKIKNQILDLYQNKELQNHCKIFGGQHHQCILQCLLKFAKS